MQNRGSGKLGQHPSHGGFLEGILYNLLFPQQGSLPKQALGWFGAAFRNRGPPKMASVFPVSNFGHEAKTRRPPQKTKKKKEEEEKARPKFPSRTNPKKGPPHKNLVSPTCLAPKTNRLRPELGHTSTHQEPWAQVQKATGTNCGVPKSVASAMFSHNFPQFLTLLISRSHSIR